MKLNLKKFMLIAFALVAVFCPFKVSALESISVGEALLVGTAYLKNYLLVLIKRSLFALKNLNFQESSVSATLNI